MLFSQYAPLSLRPLTCEVKAGHRWGPREQGCIQFQRPLKTSSYHLCTGMPFLQWLEFILCLLNCQIMSMNFGSGTRRRIYLLWSRRCFQGADSCGWLCVIALSGSRKETAQGCDPVTLLIFRKPLERLLRPPYACSWIFFNKCCSVNKILGKRSVNWWEIKQDTLSKSTSVTF